MAEPPIVDLNRYRRTDPEQLPDELKERLAEWGERLDAHGVVLSARSKARRIVEDHPDIHGLVYLKADKVEVATPSFFNELLRAWPEARLVGAHRDVQASFDLAAEEVDDG